MAGNQEMLPDADPAITMGYWTEDDIPFYYGLARTFPLADHWFSSCLGPRSPTAVSSSREPRTASSTTCRSTCSTTPAGTIFDMFTKHGISWVNYHAVPGDKRMARRYADHTRRMARRRLQRMGSRCGT